MKLSDLREAERLRSRLMDLHSARKSTERFLNSNNRLFMRELTAIIKRFSSIPIDNDVLGKVLIESVLAIIDSEIKGVQGVLVSLGVNIDE